MNDHPVHRDDITAINREGDLHAYMRSLIQPTKSTTPAAPRRKPKKWGAVPIPPNHKPGQWPPGTSPPGPAPERELPAADWDDAVQQHRTETRYQLDQQEDSE